MRKKSVHDAIIRGLRRAGKGEIYNITNAEIAENNFKTKGDRKSSNEKYGMNTYGNAKPSIISKQLMDEARKRSGGSLIAYGLIRVLIELRKMLFVFLTRPISATMLCW